MPEHFPTFNRAARLIRSASPGGRTLFERTRRALATERGLLRSGLYVLMFLAFSFHAVALLGSVLQAAGVPAPTWTFYAPYGQFPAEFPDSLIGKALSFVQQTHARPLRGFPIRDSRHLRLPGRPGRHL